MPVVNHLIISGLLAATGGLTGQLLFDDLWLAWLSFLGAAVGGAVSAPLFGRDDPLAVMRAGFGAGLATSIGGGVGASLVAGPMAFVAGTMLVWLSLLSNPCILTLFIIAMAGIHQAARALRTGFAL